MKAKQVRLTEEEKLAVQTMISLEIKSSIKAKKMDIEPVFKTEMLKALYEKIAGHEWRED